MSTTHVHYVQQLLTHFDADPRRVTLVDGDAFLTTGELAAAVRRAAAVLGRHGVTRGDVVAVLTEPNTAATLILRWAANLVGATAAHVRGVNAAVPGDELRVERQRAVVAAAGARVLAVDPGNEDRARDLLADVADRPVLAVLGAGGPGTVDLTAGSATEVVACAEVEDDDIAVITHTSGSSGSPKGVCWTFGVKNDMVAAAPWLPPAAGSAGGRTHFLITAPLTHSSGFGADDTLASGGLVVLHKGFDAGAVLRAVAGHRITRLMIGTPQLSALAEHPDRAATDTSSVTELFYMGSPGAPRRLREARQVFGPVLIQGYGTSECGGAITVLAPADHDDPRKCATAGRPLDPAGFSIRHPETGAELPDGEVGEVCAKPRWPAAGYWREPELTERLVRDGWVRTGDLGHVDAGGYLHLSGRLSDVMKVKGLRIHPTAVEKVLAEAPGVSRAAVYGVEDADRVEHIHAAVVAEPGAVVDVGELRRRVAEALSESHVPAVIDVRRELPVLGMGKPDRVRLRAEARAALVG
ncbi:fatty acid--CoA ligase family protein [Amycolatopsis sp. OK19-0408]|uniref:Fatty acid--CoA ligase family protein n=1 Tax=Amycolatopsis iheyensis TaxID=2945988 RepID=A0A9X2N9R8_9PSEU|nr:fatty acid--CoA ligase family protein [Amycolatopsis iheyensis]MCR6483201.1 fatty acid--CoA ligase family protein [Amycolatopsis iheyensis]